MSASTIAHKVNKDHWFVRCLVGTGGLIAAGVLIYVSARMNYRFGFSMGKTPEDALLYGQFSAAADTLKVLMPFMAAWGFRQKVLPVAWGATVALIVCMLWGWTGAAGHLASNRLDVTGQRAVKADSYKDLREQKARYEKELGWLAGVNRSVDAIKAEIDGAKFGKMWTTTGGCKADVTTRDRREFCQTVQKLEADLGNAMKREEYAAKLEEVSTKLAKATEGANAGTVGATEADPQASILNRLSNGVIGVPMWQVIIAILGVAVLELGGGLIPYASLTYMFGVSLRGADQARAEEASSSSAAAPAVALATIPAPLALAGPAQDASVVSPQTTDAETIALQMDEKTNNGGGEGARAIPAPPPPKPNVFLDEKPLAAAVAELRSIGFPIDGRPAGPMRPKDTPKVTAHRFVRVMKAFDKAGKHWASDLESFYDQFCVADHRERTALKEVWTALKNSTQGIEQKEEQFSKHSQTKRSRYTISPGKYPRKPSDDPAPQEVGEDQRGPFASSAVAANDPVQKQSRPHLAIVPRRAPFMAEQERWALVAEAAEARRMKAELRGQSRKQRGSRTHRFMRAA